MRTYEDMFESYLNWYAKKTNNNDYLPENFLDVDEKEANLRKGTIWKRILEMSYKKTGGVYWFCKFILGDMTYAGYPNPIRFNSLWWKWTTLQELGDHLCVKCARQHGKSTYWTVIQPVYRISLFEHYNVLIESASEEQAVMLLGYVTKIIDNNEFLASKRSKDGIWKTTEITYNGGVVRARGVGSEVRGGTYDYIACDDILRSDNKLSDRDIENFIDEELEPMILERKGQMVIVGTSKSVTDIFTTIEERIDEGSTWVLETYPAILNWDKKILLCPDRYSWDQLMAVRKRQGHIKFDKEFMCKVFSSGSQLFPHELRKLAMELGAEEVMYPTAKEARFIPEWMYVMGVDCARAGTAGADYTVAFVIAFNTKNFKKKLVWYWRKKGLKIQEQVKQIAEISKNFNHPVMLVEKNNMGQDFIDIMIDDYNLNVEVFTTGGRGQAKEDLIRMLIIAFENEKIIMPTGNKASKDAMKLLDRELEKFVIEVTSAGNERYKGSGRSHDDMVMALALANRCTQQYGFSPCAVSLDTTNKHTTDLERFATNFDFREVLKI